MKIDSIKDPKIIYARQLANSKGRLENNGLLLEGLEQINWALSANLEIEHMFVHDKITEHEIFTILNKSNIPYYFVTDGILKKITDTNYIVPFVAVAKNPTIKTNHKAEFILVLDNLVDHGNIGTIIRSAAAFGIKNVISTNDSADFFIKKTIDASRGKVFSANIKKFSTDQATITYLKDNGYQIIATSPHAPQVQSLTQLADKPIALVLGNETDGCTQNFIDQADLLIQIPMSSEVESLNVAVAAGISMYELKMKLVLAMLIHKIYQNLGRQVGVTANLIRRALDVELKRVIDLSAMQVILLLILKCDGFVPIEQIEKDTDEHENDLELFLEPLILKHYIVGEIRVDSTYFGLTKLGEEFVAKLWPIIEKTEARVLKDFSDSERAQLIEYLARMQANCHEIIESK